MNVELKHQNVERVSATFHRNLFKCFMNIFANELTSLHTHEANCVMFSPDGNTLASTCWDSTVRLWDPNDGSEIRTYTEHTINANAVAFNPDSKIVTSSPAPVLTVQSTCGQ